MEQKLNASKLLDCVQAMPELDHFPGKGSGKRFEIRDSEVVGWLVVQKDVMQWLFEQMNQRRLIIYDPKKRKWSGRLVTEVEVIPELPPARKGRPPLVNEEILLKCPGLADGVRTKELAAFGATQGISRSTVYRCMDRLIGTGHLEGIEDRKWKIRNGPLPAATCH